MRRACWSLQPTTSTLLRREHGTTASWRAESHDNIHAVTRTREKVYTGGQVGLALEYRDLLTTAPSPMKFASEPSKAEGVHHRLDIIGAVHFACVLWQGRERHATCRERDSTLRGTPTISPVACR